MEELEQLKQKLERERPVRWEELPDLALYMDQLISYMPRQLIHFDGDEQLTAAMVNNYIKDTLVPRADGKRYNRSHLAFLTAVCALKKVLSVKDIALLLDEVRGEHDARELYADFTGTLDGALGMIGQTLDADTPEEQLPHLALELALRGYADQLACARVLSILRQRRPAPEGGKEKKEKSKPKKQEEGEQEHE